MSSEAYPWDSFRHHRDMDPALCFILTPFRPEFAGTRQVIEEVTRELNLRCERVDDIQRSGTIHADIWAGIQRAAIVVADITDANPNVLLELGVATAIKEHFRVVLLVRGDSASPIPFDLGPFRHIRYDNSLMGATELRNRVREFFRSALTEDSVMSSITAQMEEWARADNNYLLVVSPETLPRLKGFAGIREADPMVLAYLLAGAIKHGVDLTWWAEICANNRHGAEVACELLVGPWIKPQFRAAFILQYLDRQLSSSAIEQTRRLCSIPRVTRLLDAVASQQVVEFTTNEGSEIMNESDKYELLQAFSPKIRIRLSGS